MKTGQLAHVSFVCLLVTLIDYTSFWRKKVGETKGIKIKLGKRNSDNHLGIILIRLQIINWINLY